MPSDINKPPYFQPDAMATDRGWVHPVTGELLVAVRGGVKQFQESIKEVTPVVETLKEEVPVKVIDENATPDTVLSDTEETPATLTEEKKPKKSKKAK